MSSSDLAAGPLRARPFSRFREDLDATWEVLFEPRRAFRALGDRTPWLAPWLVVSVLSIALTILLISLSERASAHMMADLPSSERTTMIQRQLDQMKIVTVSTAPVALLVRWMATSVCLWALAILTAGAAGWKAMLSIVAYSALPGVLGKAVDLVVAWVDGPEFTAEMIPVIGSATSFAALWPGAIDNAWAKALLAQVTPFTLWGLALWTVGVKERLDLGWRKSSAVTGPVWLLLVALGAAAEVILGSLTSAVTQAS
jgi:hypothetical protein